MLFSLPRRVGISASAIIYLMLSACAPLVTGSDQCQDLNYALTRAKDEPLSLGSWSEVDALMNDHVDRPDVAGCAVAIVREGDINYIGTYGLAAAPPGDVGVKVDTVFPVGSISKPITALAVLKLVDDGHIGSLDDPIGDYTDIFDAVRPSWNAITIRQLLAHASGVDYWPQFAGPVNDANDLESLFGQFASIRPDLTAPAMAVGGPDGTGFSPIPGLPDEGPFLIGTAPYSNVGYTLLGAVIAEIAQAEGLATGYEDYVYRYVALKEDNPLTALAPASMCLMPYWRLGDIPNLSSRADASGAFRPLAETWSPAAGDLWGWEGPSGGWTMTVGDLARLGLTMVDDLRISSDLTQDMQQTHAQTTTNVGTPYGLGTYTGNLLGQPSVGHGGVIGSANEGSFQSDLAIRRDASLGVAMVCNSGPRLRVPNADLNAIFGEVAQAALQSDPTLPVTAELSPEARLLRDHGATLAVLARGMRRPDGGADMDQVRRELARLPEGEEILKRFQAGDFTAASRLLNSNLDRVTAAPPQPLEPLYPF